MQKISEIEDKIIYLCDDDTGLLELIAKELGVSEKVARQLLENLKNKGLLSLEFHGKCWWYVPTIAGKEYLMRKAQDKNSEAQ